MKSYKNTLSWIQVWFHDILHDTEIIPEFMKNEFMYDFMIMNSFSQIHTWIHSHAFWYMNSRYSSWLWIHIWIRTLNSYMNSLSWIHIRHFMILWIHIWIHVYEEYCEIIPEIMCTKVPDVGFWGSSCPTLSWAGPWCLAPDSSVPLLNEMSKHSSAYSSCALYFSGADCGWSCPGCSQESQQ